MGNQRTQLVGLFLILGAAIGFALGLILADLGAAAIFGAVGGGLGLVVGAIVDLWSAGRRDRDRRS